MFRSWSGFLIGLVEFGLVLAVIHLAETGHSNWAYFVGFWVVMVSYLEGFVKGSLDEMQANKN